MSVGSSQVHEASDEKPLDIEAAFRRRAATLSAGPLAWAGLWSTPRTWRKK